MPQSQPLARQVHGSSALPSACQNPICSPQPPTGRASTSGPSLTLLRRSVCACVNTCHLCPPQGLRQPAGGWSPRVQPAGGWSPRARGPLTAPPPTLPHAFRAWPGRPHREAGPAPSGRAPPLPPPGRLSGGSASGHSTHNLWPAASFSACPHEPDRELLPLHSAGHRLQPRAGEGRPKDLKDADSSSLPAHTSLLKHLCRRARWFHSHQYFCERSTSVKYNAREFLGQQNLKIRDIQKSSTKFLSPVNKHGIPVRSLRRCPGRPLCQLPRSAGHAGRPGSRTPATRLRGSRTPRATPRQ